MQIPTRQPAAPGDLDVLVAAAAHDGEAFARLYDRFVERVYRYAYRRLGSHADAEDLTAQTFRRALERIASYEQRGVPFEAWLFRIAHNLVVDQVRAGPGAMSLDGLGERGFDPADQDGATPADSAVQGEQAGAAWAAVAGLPPLQRRAVTLRFGQDLSNAEVSACIGRSEAATKQLIYRAMLTLRRQLCRSQEDDK